jgi:hypothetical protein
MGASAPERIGEPPSFSNGFAAAAIVPVPVTANHFAQTLQVVASISTSKLPSDRAVTVTELAAVTR